MGLWRKHGLNVSIEYAICPCADPFSIPRKQYDIVFTLEPNCPEQRLALTSGMLAHSNVWVYPSKARSARAVVKICKERLTC